MCNKCKTRPRANYKNSHSTWCAECEREYQRQYKAKQPKQALVYSYFDRDGNCIYVGRGNESRTKTHKYHNWWNNDLLLVTMTCKNEWQAMEYEGRWGGHYLPKMNIDGYRR